MILRRSSYLLVVALVALSLGAAFASPASALPAWRFSGIELTGTESVIGDDVVDTVLTIPGLSTACKRFPYAMIAFNELTTAKGEFTEVGPEKCSTNSTCTVEEITAEKLPWHLHGVTVSLNP